MIQKINSQVSWFSTSDTIIQDECSGNTLDFLDWGKSSIPDSLSATYWQVTLIPEKPKNILWRKAREKLLDTELQWLDEKDITFRLNDLNSAYEFAKQHFDYTDLRDDGDRYFKHLFRSAYILLETCENPTILKLVCTLLHDVVENTDHVYPESLIPLFSNEIFGKKVALSVALMSKKSIKQIGQIHNNEGIRKTIARFEDISNQQVAEMWPEYRIINEKGFLTRYFKNRRKNNQLSSEENTLYDEYQTLKNQNRRKINNEYFPRYNTSGTMEEKAREWNEKMWLHLSNEDILEVVEATLDSKDSERLDNLQTEHHSSKNKQKKKAIEFNKQFRPRLEREKPEFLKYCDTALKKLLELWSISSIMEGVKNDTHTITRWKKTS